MKRDYLELLVCPRCLPREEGLELLVSRQRAARVLEGELKCKSCKARYPIQEGIPILARAGLEDFVYQEDALVSNYLWLHYKDLLLQEERNPLAEYASILGRAQNFLDLGCAGARLVFEISKEASLSVGIDLSFKFIRSARELFRKGQIKIHLPVEGVLMREVILRLPEDLRVSEPFLLVADACSIPFRKGLFDAVASLNTLDRVPDPLKHLRETNRVLSLKQGRLLISDPYSWDRNFTPPSKWLGGRKNGRFKGRGHENLKKIIGTDYGIFLPPLNILQEGEVHWKLRHHENRSELIRSLYLLAQRP